MRDDLPDPENANSSVCTHGGVGPTESLGSEHKMPSPNNLSCLVAQLIEYLSRILTFEAHWRQLILKWLSWVVLHVWVGPCCLTKQQTPYYTKKLRDIAWRPFPLIPSHPHLHLHTPPLLLPQLSPYHVLQKFHKSHFKSKYRPYQSKQHMQHVHMYHISAICGVHVACVIIHDFTPSSRQACVPWFSKQLLTVYLSWNHFQFCYL